MSEAFTGQIMPWSISFAPENWAFCDGRLLKVMDYTALYSLIGTIYGGDGINTFALPDLRGRVAVGAGTGPGLSTYQLGQSGGTEKVVISADNLPAHTHPTPASNSAASTGTPAPTLAPATTPRGSEIYASPVNASLAPTAGNSTSHQPVENRQPLLAVNYIICLNGIYPTRP